MGDCLADKATNGLSHTKSYPGNWFHGFVIIYTHKCTKRNEIKLNLSKKNTIINQHISKKSWIVHF